MKNVLIVDDEQGFLLSLQDMCKEHTDKFRIITANNGKEALEILANQDISLVVTDLKMPVMDGFELASQISRLDRSVPIIVMTAFGTPEMEDRLMNMGAFQYIEKPIDFSLLLQKIQDGLAAGPRGHVTGISLPSFLQLLELDNKTCTIVAKAGRRIGLLFFLNGTLINAYTDPIEGLDAAFEIISWNQAEITIYNFCQNRKRTIEAPLGFILIEGARRIDEQAEKEMAMGNGGGTSAHDDELDQLDNLDFDTAPPLPPLLAGEDLLPEIPLPLEDQIRAVPGVHRMVLIAADGSVVAQHGVENKGFKPFVTYMAVAADNMRTTLGSAHLPAHIILSQTMGEKLLIVPGQRLSVGIEVSPDVSPVKIAAQVRPILAAAEA